MFHLANANRTELGMAATRMFKRFPAAAYTTAPAKVTRQNFNICRLIFKVIYEAAVKPVKIFSFAPVYC
jgi:hypothetical protein